MCHCERSEAISIVRKVEIAAVAFGSLAMTKTVPAVTASN